MHPKYLWFGLILLICPACCLLAVAEPAAPGPEPILIHATDLVFEPISSDVEMAGIRPALWKKEPGSNISMPYTPVYYEIRPGGIVSPEIPPTVPEVLYLTGGSALVRAGEETVECTPGTAVLIPAGMERSISNTGTDRLTCYSFTAEEGTGEGTSGGEEQEFLVIPPDSVRPVTFENPSDRTYYSVTRLLQPDETPLPIPYDLILSSVPSGGRIDEHYINGSSQLVIPVKGSANITVSATTVGVRPGDILYIPENAVQTYDAIEDLDMIVVTWPYYRALNDVYTGASGLD